MDIRYQHDRDRTVLCALLLNKKSIAKFQSAVKRNFWYLAYIDDLPLYGELGHCTQSAQQQQECFLYIKWDITLYYNPDDNGSGNAGKQIVGVEMKHDKAIPLSKWETRDESDEDVAMMEYSVTWKVSDTKFEDRFNRYANLEFFNTSVHWYSIVFSCITVIIMTFIVLGILVRTLKADLQRYVNESELANQVLDDFEKEFGSEEYGWKLLHADVFRPPSNLLLFSVLIGNL